MLLTLWKEIRTFCYNTHKIQQKLLPPVVVLFLVYMIVRWSRTPVVHVWDGESDLKFIPLEESEITNFLANLHDERTKPCIEKKYKSFKDQSVSIILDFHQHQFYDLKLTLESINKYTPEELIKEIIIIDDGSTSKEIRQESLSFMSHDKFKKKIKGYRSESIDGSSQSKFKASKLASGDILVFVSSEVAVTPGWIQPLLHAVSEDKTTIAVSHLDSILEGYTFHRNNDNLTTIFDWTLTTRFMETSEKGDIHDAAAFKGGVFAVDSSFFSNVGAFDEHMDGGGGENLELSIRAHLCGGNVKIHSCSRVAVLNALRPVYITSPRNFRRIAELWLDTQAYIAYKQSGTSKVMNEEESQKLHSRRFYLKQNLKCESFKSFLAGKAKAIIVPPPDSRKFGKLRVSTGFCVKGIKEGGSDWTPKLRVCLPHIYEDFMIWSMDSMGRLKHGSPGMCIAILNSQIVVQTCAVKDVNQMWNLDENGLIKSPKYETKCLSTFGDDDNKGLSLSECNSDKNQVWSFVMH